MRDLGIAHYYVPFAMKTEILSHKQYGVGVVRKIFSNTGSWVLETVISWDEGTGFLICVHRGKKGRLSAPVESIWFRYELGDGSGALDNKGSFSNTCSVRLVIYYRLRGGIWMLPVRAIMHLIFRANLRFILNRLKIYYEIGYYKNHWGSS